MSTLPSAPADFLPSAAGTDSPAPDWTGDAVDAADDHELLRDYRAGRNEAAFHQIVRRHFAAVWSAARRMVNGDAALAEDICQEVFTHLALHAAKLPPRVVLGGWLHRHTCFTAAKTLRAAARRRSREQLAAANTVMNSPDSTPSSSGPDDGFSASPWADLAPHLDAALNRLPAADRDAVVLRFFEKRGFPAMATALNTTEDAARMRTNRALEKLRRLLGRHQPGRRGAAILTAAALAALLRENSVAAFPAGPAAAAGTAARVAAAALTKSASVLTPAGAAAGAGTGTTALRAWLRSNRPTLLGGTALIAALGTAWYLNNRLHGEEQTGSPRALVALSGKSPGNHGSILPVPSGAQLEVTLDYLLVSEGQALALLNERWNGESDTELRNALLSQAGGAQRGVPAEALSAGFAGTRLVKSLTGTLVSGARQMLEDAQPMKVRTGKAEPPPGFVLKEGQAGNPDGFEIHQVGTVVTLGATLSDDGQWCSVNLESRHHFAKPQLLDWSGASSGATATGSFPARESVEFREAAADARLLQRIGSSTLIQSSQLPAAAPAAADGGPGGGAVTSSGSPVRLFVFLTIQSASLP